MIKLHRFTHVVSFSKCCPHYTPKDGNIFAGNCLSRDLSSFSFKKKKITLSINFHGLTFMLVHNLLTNIYLLEHWVHLNYDVPKWSVGV